MGPGSALASPTTTNLVVNHKFLISITNCFSYHQLSQIDFDFNLTSTTSIIPLFCVCYRYSSLLNKQVPRLWPTKGTPKHGFNFVLPSLSNCIFSQTQTHSQHSSTSCCNLRSQFRSRALSLKSQFHNSNNISCRIGRHLRFFLFRRESR